MQLSGHQGWQADVRLVQAHKIGFSIEKKEEKEVFPRSYVLQGAADVFCAHKPCSPLSLPPPHPDSQHEAEQTPHNVHFGAELLWHA